MKISYDEVTQQRSFGSVFDENGSTRVFEIDWRSKNEIKVFEYGNLETYLSYYKNDIEINYMMVSTGEGSEGEWEVWLLN